MLKHTSETPTIIPTISTLTRTNETLPALSATKPTSSTKHHLRRHNPRRLRLRRYSFNQRTPFLFLAILFLPSTRLLHGKQPAIILFHQHPRTHHTRERRLLRRHGNDRQRAPLPASPPSRFTE